MQPRVFGVLILSIFTLVVPLFAPLGTSEPRATVSAAHITRHAAIPPSYGQLPISFEPNMGQADASVRYLAHGHGYTLALSPSAAVISLQAPLSNTQAPGRFALPEQPTVQPDAPSTVFGMRWLGANPNPLVTGEQPLPGTVNYFLGNAPSRWHTNIPTYQQVRMHDVYPGIDLVYYGNQGQLEYDFVVAPGADPSRISLGFTGTNVLGVDLAGNLSLALPGGPLQQAKPLIYQSVNGVRQPIAGGFTLAANQRVGFVLGAYNKHLPLVIDPAYRFSTYLGGSGGDFGKAIAVDGTGSAYIAGYTNSTNFPTASPLQGTNSGSYDVFVSKLNAAGTALAYSTYLGGSCDEYGNGIAVDASGNAYITGWTCSTAFPTTAGAWQTTTSGLEDVFVSKLNAGGSSLVYSTFLGSSNTDKGDAIAVDSSGNAYVTGWTQSVNFPTTVGVVQAVYNNNGDAFVSKLNATGSALVYSTFLGGSGGDQGNGIAVDASGNAYIVGTTQSTDFPTHNPLQANAGGGNTMDDAFVSELNTDASALVYSTYLGGSGADVGYGIAVDGSGNAYVTGETDSADFPTQSPLQNSAGGNADAFVSKVNASGSSLAYSTYLGGSDTEIGYAIAVDSTGIAYVTGWTKSTDFPLASPLQSSLHRQSGDYVSGDVFFSSINASGSALLLSTYIGGMVNDIGYGVAVGTGGNIYVTGLTSSTDFPAVNAFQPNNAGPGDTFITKILTLPSVDTTTGVFRPSNGVLYLKNANTTGPADITLYYGQPGDQPITGDWTGKGYKSIGIFRNGTFYLRNSNTTGYADITVSFGNSTDIPVAGDWTGKGYDSIGVYRPSTNTFLLRNSNTAGAPDIVARLGISGDVPIVGDWTGKGFDSIGVFRPSNGIVYMRNSNSTGVADINFVYGKAGDKPVVGDWDGNGTDTIGVDRGGRFLLRNSNSTGPANFSFYLGVNGDDPIAGPWLAPASAPPPVHRGPSTPTHPATVALPGAPRLHTGG